MPTQPILPNLSSRNSSPSEDGSQYHGSFMSDRSNVSASRISQTAPIAHRSGYGARPSGLVAEEAYNAHLGPYPNVNTSSGWAPQEPYHNSNPYYLSSSTPSVGYPTSAPSDPTYVHEHRLLFPHDTSPSARYTTHPPLQSHTLLPPAYISPDFPSTYQENAATTQYADYPRGGGYERTDATYAPPAASFEFTDAELRMPYLPSAYAQPSGMSQPPTSVPAHARVSQTRCEWGLDSKCGMLLAEDSCAGVRRHLRDEHFRGSPPAGKDLIRCEWGGGGCRREPMQWENIPKHIAECHTKAMARQCSQCGDRFARSDTLKRHRDSGNCCRGVCHT